MLLTLIMNLGMAAGTVAAPPTPGTGGGGSYIRKVWPKPKEPVIEPPVYHDEDMIAIFRKFLEVNE